MPDSKDKLKALETELELDSAETELGKYFDLVAKHGLELRVKNQKLREGITAKGMPDAVVITDTEDSEELRMWKIVGGVVVIGFRKGRADINNITQHTDEFVDALVRCKDQLR